MAKRKMLTSAQKRTPKASSQVQRARQAEVKNMSARELKSYIANEGKRLNQQLAEIQKRGLQTQSFAYSKLVDQPKYSQYLGKSKSGKVKVELATRGKKRGELQRMASLIQKFVNTKTITVSGIKDYYKNVFTTLRSKYDGFLDLTDDQLADILKTEGFAHAKAVVGSDVIFKMIHTAADVDFMADFLESAGALRSKNGMINKFKNMYNREWQTLPAGVKTPFDF